MNILYWTIGGLVLVVAVFVGWLLEEEPNEWERAGNDDWWCL